MEEASLFDLLKPSTPARRMETNDQMMNELYSLMENGMASQSMSSSLLFGDSERRREEEQLQQQSYEVFTPSNNNISHLLTNITTMANIRIPSDTSEHLTTVIRSAPPEMMTEFIGQMVDRMVESVPYIAEMKKNEGRSQLEVFCEFCPCLRKV